MCFLWASCQNSKTPNPPTTEFIRSVNAGLDSVTRLRAEEQYEDAFKYLIRLIEPAKHLPEDDCTRARFHWEMGDFLRISGSFIPALHHLKLANSTDFSLCEIDVLGHTQAETFGTIGSVYLLTSLEWNKDSALHYFRRADEIALGYENPTDRASASNNLGIAYMNLDEDTRAKQLFENSLEMVMYKSQRDTDLVVSVLDNLGLMALKHGNYLEALHFFQQKETLFLEQEHDPFYDASHMRNLLQMASIALTKMGSDSLAMSYIDILEASKAYSTNPRIEHQMDVLEIKRLCSKKTGNLERVVQFAEQEIYAKDSFLIKVREESASYAKLFVDYELLISRMPGEFSSTAGNGTLNRFKQLSRTTKLLIIICLLMVIVLVIALFYKYTRKSKKDIERFEGELEAKTSDLEELEINLEMKRKQSGDLTESITEIRKMNPSDQQRAINRLSLELNSQMLNEERKDLIGSNAQFYARLNEQHAGLTITERELCAVVKLGLSNKEVAAIRNIDPASAKRSKNRLAKKLGLGSAAELYDHLCAI